MRFTNRQAKAVNEKKKRAELLKQRQVRNVRSRLSSNIKEKQKESKRDKTLNSIRNSQSKDLELDGFDFLFSFGGLC